MFSLNVSTIFHTFKIFSQMSQLLIILIIVIWYDGDAIVDLEAITKCCLHHYISYIIYEQHIVQWSIDYSQVFDIAMCCFLTAISKISMVDVFLLWIEVVGNHLTITFMACREDYQLEVLR